MTPGSIDAGIELGSDNGCFEFVRRGVGARHCTAGALDMGLQREDISIDAIED